jgi:RimJ/RimL family protein N-acetyltransferase
MISFGDFVKEVEHENNHYLVGMVGTYLVGYANLTRLGSTTVSMFAMIAQEHRNKGYGKQLVKSAYLWGTHNGYQNAMATVDGENAAGIALLRSCGFAYEGVAPSKGGLKDIYVKRS